MYNYETSTEILVKMNSLATLKRLYSETKTYYDIETKLMNITDSDINQKLVLL